MILKQDELNNLEKSNRKVPSIKEYFKDMDITGVQRKEREKLADKLLDVMLFLFALVSLNKDKGIVLTEYEILAEFRVKFKAEISEIIHVDEYVERYINDITEKIVSTTLKEPDLEPNTDFTSDEGDNYALSDERALYVAENEANTVCNYKDYEEAIANGCKYKVWITENDQAVRKTHIPLHEKKIPIQDLFAVGNAFMRFPKDQLSDDAREIVNCRCSIKYFK